MKYQTSVIKAIVRKNLWFITPYLLLLGLSGVYLLISVKGSEVLCLDHSSTDFFDFFFVFYTHVGDGIFGAIVAILLLFINRKQAFSIGFGLILAGLISQLLKQSLGMDSMRPSLFFENQHVFHEIEFLNRHFHHSMPSGHTTTAFCLFFMLSLFSEKKTYAYLFLTLAVLVGVSRIYLAQHFLTDVVAGSLIGCVIGFLAYYLGNKWFRGTGMEKPLISLG